MQEKSSGEISRKRFIRLAALAGIATQIPWYVSCDAESERTVPNDLDGRQAVLDILFPSDGDGPGALDCYADKYIDWVVSDPLLNPRENAYVIDGFEKIDNVSREKKGQVFGDLSRKDQEELIHELSKDSWGKSYLSKLLTLIFEAMLTHPLYGGNPDKVTWEWLGHYPGRPEPIPELMYPQILKTIRED